MSRYHTLLRSYLLKEGEKPDKDVVDHLLDKISDKGKDSLRDVEKKYLDQASQGDIDPEVENEVKEVLSGKKEWLERVEKGKPIRQDEVDEVPQDILDMNVMNRLGTGSPIQPYVLEKVSQNIIDEYVSEGRFLDIPNHILILASQDAVDAYLYHQMDRIGKIPELNNLKLASQSMVDKIIKQYGEKGKVLTDDTLQLASEEAREDYKESMNKKRQEESIIRSTLREHLLKEDMSSKCDCCDRFDMEDAKMVYGGLEKPLYYMLNKRTMHQLKYLSPTQYLEKVARDQGFNDIEDMKSNGPVQPEKIDEFAEAMKGSADFPVITYSSSGEQEGRHRAFAAKEAGCDIIPVVVEEHLDDDRLKFYIDKFRDMSFEEIDRYFKDMGYDGITKLGYQDLQRSIGA